MRLTGIESFFHSCNIYRDCPRGVYQEEAKMCKKNVLKWRTFELAGWITGKQLKIKWVHAASLRCIWQALNPLSIYVTFTAIIPGAYPGRPKCAKMANFWTCGLNYWETVEDRWVHAAMRLTSIESSFHPCNIYRDCPMEAKMCLRLSWRSQMPAPAKQEKATTYRRDSPEVAKGWLQKLTNVPLAIAILLVTHANESRVSIAIIHVCKCVMSVINKTETVETIQSPNLPQA